MIRVAGRFVLFMAAVFLLLFLANLRSRIYYHGPNYGFLLWIFFYCVAVGFGLLKSKKWAVLLLFVPGILSIAVFAYAWAHGARALMPWALLNYAFVVALLGAPALMLRRWRELHW
jgi:hypothetical protein